MAQNIDQKTLDKAADGDGNAQFRLALSYKNALEELPDEVNDPAQNETLQGNRLLLANEFHKMLREATMNGSRGALDYVQDLTHQNKVPLERYDGKLFRGMAELAKAGDENAKEVAVSISKGLKKALLNKIEDLDFPGKLSGKPKETARNLLNAQTEQDFSSVADTIQKSYNVFKDIALKHSSDRALSSHYNTQSKALEQIDKGLKVYRHMVQTLDEIHYQKAEPS